MNFYKAGRKKILIFSLAYTPFVGGAELAVKEITDRVNDADFDLITLRFKRDWPKFEKIGNINVHRIGGGKLMFPFSAFCKSSRLYKKNKYDLIWSIMANRAGFAAMFFKTFHPKVKFLLTLQEGDPIDYPEKRMGVLKMIFGKMFRKIFTKADYVQAISSYLAEWAKNMGAKPELVKVVPNGVSIKNHQGLPLISRGVLDGEENPKIIITTSRLVRKNGIDVLIKAAARLKNLMPEKKFVIQILGAGPDEKKLKDLAKELKIEDMAQFLGHIEPEKIPNYLSQADVFVRASRSEGLGSSFLEAMVAGLPVIGTPVGGIVDFLKDPSTSSGQAATGLFCKVDDPDDLAEKIQLLLTDDNLRERIAENGRKLVMENYSWGSVSDKMKNIFAKLK